MSFTAVFATDYENKQNKETLGFGLNLGYPGAGLAVRYHTAKNNIRWSGVLLFDYDGAGDGVCVDANLEYAFPLELNKQKFFYLDFAPTIGAGVYIPFDDADFAVAVDLGLVISMDLPYKDVPLTVYTRFMYRPTLVFDDDIDFNWDEKAYHFGLGLTWNFDC